MKKKKKKKEGKKKKKKRKPPRNVVQTITNFALRLGKGEKKEAEGKETEKKGEKIQRGKRGCGRRKRNEYN